MKIVLRQNCDNFQRFWVKAQSNCCGNWERFS